MLYARIPFTTWFNFHWYNLGTGTTQICWFLKNPHCFITQLISPYLGSTKKTPFLVGSNSPTFAALQPLVELWTRLAADSSPTCCSCRASGMTKAVSPITALVASVKATWTVWKSMLLINQDRVLIKRWAADHSTPLDLRDRIHSHDPGGPGFKQHFLLS